MPRAVIKLGGPAPRTTPKKPFRPKLRKRPEAPLAREALVDLDREIARLARMGGAQRLRIGQALVELERRGWHHQLGFSSVGAYVVERCGQLVRWGLESCALARKLQDLPVLRAALAGMTLSWSMVLLLARRATPETESGLAAQAAGSTVRHMRKLLQDDDAQPSSPDEDHATISITMSVTDAWLLEHTAWLFQLVEPKGNKDQFIHWLVAEGMTSLREIVPGGELAELDAKADELREQIAAWRAQRRAWCDEAEARVEAGLDLDLEHHPVAPANDIETEPAWDSFPTPRKLDAYIRGLCQELAARDLLLGALAERFWKSDGWRRLGFASETQYSSERLGVSLSSIKTKRALARRTERMPSVTAAIERRAIGFESALLVTRVATETTVDAWLARAAERTVKLLREEVEAAELRIRMGEPRDQLPPDEAALAELARRREAAGAAMASDTKAPFVKRALGVLGQLSVGLGGRSLPKGTSATRAERGLGRARYRFNVTRDTRELWCSFEEAFNAARGWLPPGTTPIQFLAVAFCTEWLHVLDKDIAYWPIYLRDGKQCKSPICTRGDVTPHHLRFRSQGGDDNPENVASVCAWCHLFGVHEGLIKALPPASDIYWEFGRDPILIVDGRTKIEMGDEAQAA